MSASQIIPLNSVIGRLTVIGPEEGLNSDSYVYRCQCSCGSPARTFRKKDLKSGRILSCGCLHREISSARMTAANTTHGMREFPEYRSWKQMVQRCTNPKCEDYPNYGGRGITISPEFRDSFKAFYDHIGPKPSGYSVDRIENEKGYERGNVRWANDYTQANNRRNNVRLTFNGMNMTLAQWDRHCGFPRGTIRQRMKKFGWNLEQAITLKNAQVGNRFTRINEPK